MKPGQQKRIDAAFTHHPAKSEGQVARYAVIRLKLHQMATLFCDLCPDSRELNGALKCLEEAQHWAIASIARNE